MSKITVKHYINTNLKPYIDEGLLYYPIYVKVIYNKFTTNKRSNTGIITTEKSFEFYNKNGKLLEKETRREYAYYTDEDLFKEIRIIENSILISEKWEFKIKRNNIFDLISEYSKNVNDYLRTAVIYDIKRAAVSKPETIGSDIGYENFLLCFSGNIIDSIEKIENFTKVSILSFVNESDLIEFRALQIIERITNPQTTFAEFVFMGLEDKVRAELKNENVEYCEKVILSIGKIIDKGVKLGKTTALIASW